MYKATRRRTPHDGTEDAIAATDGMWAVVADRTFDALGMHLYTISNGWGEDDRTTYTGTYDRERKLHAN